MSPSQGEGRGSKSLPPLKKNILMAPALIETFSNKQQGWIVNEVVPDGETKWIGTYEITGTTGGFKINDGEKTVKCEEDSCQAGVHFVSVNCPYTSREGEAKTDIYVIAASQTRSNLEQLLTYPGIKRLIGVDLIK